MGKDVTDIASPARSGTRDAREFPRALSAASARDAARHALPPLRDIDANNWRTLSENAIEPSGFYLAGWELAVNAHLPARGNALALAATGNDPQRVTGLVPVVSAWHAYKIPLPVLVSADPYGTLRTPLLDRDHAIEAATQLMQRARDAGAHALVLRDIPLDGQAYAALNRALEREHLRSHVLDGYERAALDATRNADDLLREALGPKKLKELRRQRNRLAEHGDVIFTIAATPAEVARDLEIFLALEASGWKAERGTALIQDRNDAAFIREAVTALAARGQCEVVTLHAGDTPVASGIVVRHLDRAFFFKLGIDERFAKLSPGVQLTLELTRHLCADPQIAFADSIALPGHPMIDPIWRGRLAIGDVLVPLYPHSAAVPVMRLALSLRKLARDRARHAVHFIRHLREKKS